MNLSGSTLALAMAFAGAFGSAVALLVLVVRLTARYAVRHRERFERGVGARMHEAFLFVDTARLLVLQHLLTLSAALVAWWLTAAWHAALGVAFAAALLPRWTLARLRRGRVEAFRRQLPDFLMLIAGGLRSGSGLQQAIAQAAAEIGPPARHEFGLLLREQRLGASLGDALASFARRMPIEESVLFASALSIGAAAGGSMAATLESLADSMRRKLSIEGRIRALTAQGRLQAWVMSALPALLGAALFVVEPVAMRALVTTWQGWLVCAVVVSLQAAGFLAIRRIVAIDV